MELKYIIQKYGSHALAYKFASTPEEFTPKVYTKLFVDFILTDLKNNREELDQIVEFCVDNARNIWQYIKLIIDFDAESDFRFWPKLHLLCAEILELSSETNDYILELQTDIIEYSTKLALGNPAKCWLDLLEGWEAPAKRRFEKIERYLEREERNDHPSDPYENHHVESHRRGYNDGRNGYFRDDGRERR